MSEVSHGTGYGESRSQVERTVLSVEPPLPLIRDRLEEQYREYVRDLVNEPGGSPTEEGRLLPGVEAQVIFTDTAGEPIEVAARFIFPPRFLVSVGMVYPLEIPESTNKSPAIIYRHAANVVLQGTNYGLSKAVQEPEYSTESDRS